MVSLFDLALDHLAGDLNGHTADLVLEVIDCFFAFLRNIRLGSGAGLAWWGSGGDLSIPG